MFFDYIWNLFAEKVKVEERIPELGILRAGILKQMSEWDTQDEGRGQEYWDRFFLGLAKYVATASKDPSTKVGAVIVDQDRRIVSLGYNGFPKHVKDSPERYADRDQKLKFVVHAETNAVLFAKRSLEGCTIYTYPIPSCSRCSSMIINTGITRCVAPPMSDELKARWGEDIEFSKTMFFEAGVQFDIVDFDEQKDLS